MPRLHLVGGEATVMLQAEELHVEMAEVRYLSANRSSSKLVHSPPELSSTKPHIRAYTQRSLPQNEYVSADTAHRSGSTQPSRLFSKSRRRPIHKISSART